MVSVYFGEMTEVFISAQSYDLLEASWVASMTVSCMSGVLTMSTTAPPTRFPPPAVCQPRSTACQSNLVPPRLSVGGKIFLGKVGQLVATKINSSKNILCILESRFRRYFIPDQYPISYQHYKLNFNTNNHLWKLSEQNCLCEYKIEAKLPSICKSLEDRILNN